MECIRNNFNAGVVLGGRYQTVSPLQHGSFGMVFMAKDLKTDQTVAIKCLTKKSAAAAEETDFELELAIDEKSEELALHSRLGNHPNIVNLLDSFETDAHTYLVLEFCERGDLYEAIRLGQGPLETEHVRRFVKQLIEAVRYMHSKGIYHRDIKPENIFLTESGSIKLGDFGLATTEEWTFENSVGSDRYMSPEQYDSAGAGYSPAKADIWAIGVCLLNVLFSRNPFSTPTESDPLFLDFSRDKQSLFDVFPSMSQDTYEVIVHCMNLDPRKRSLDGALSAIDRVISFTTLDEALDDFCTADRPVVATANREPLRTPSVQSPQVDNGAFPWAKALHASPKPIRQLSVIPDNESYTEDLFSKSDATTTGWLSGSVQTSSVASVLDSSFGASMQSLHINPLRINRPKLAAANVSPAAGSLPISMNKTRQSAMSFVFGRKDAVSKSWSDLWDEDFEEEQEHAKQLETLKEMNSRTWSHESKADVDNEDTPRQGLSPATKSAALNARTDKTPSIAATISNDIDGDLPADGFFFHEAPPVKEKPTFASPYAPPSKRDGFDKWAALGERRRAVAGNDSGALKAPELTLRSGNEVGSSLHDKHLLAGHVVSDSEGHSTPHKDHTAPSNWAHAQHHHFSNAHHTTPNAKWSHQSHQNTAIKDRAKEHCPWTATKGREGREARDRDWNWNFNWRNKEKRHDSSSDGGVGW